MELWLSCASSPIYLVWRTDYWQVNLNVASGVQEVLQLAFGLKDLGRGEQAREGHSGEGRLAGLGSGTVRTAADYSGSWDTFPQSVNGESLRWGRPCVTLFYQSLGSFTDMPGASRLAIRGGGIRRGGARNAAIVAIRR